MPDGFCKLLWRNCRRSHSGHNKTGGVIGQHTGGKKIHSGRQPQAQSGDDGIPGPGHVKNISGHCGNMPDLIRSGKQGHTLRAKRDEKAGAARIFQQAKPCPHNIFPCMYGTSRVLGVIRKAP